MDFDPVGSIMAWISTYGLWGLCLIAVAERFVPVIPSYGLLVAVGIAATEGAWTLSFAYLTSAAGSLLGCAVGFCTAWLLGADRSRLLINGAGRLFGLSPKRMDGWIRSFHKNQVLLAFSLQLVPTVRLFAPAFAGLLRVNSRRFLMASATGIALWNGVFIGAGFLASRSVDTDNTTLVALGVLIVLLALEVVALWIGRFRARPASDVGACKA